MTGVVGGGQVVVMGWGGDGGGDVGLGGATWSATTGTS